ncbi:MAG: SPFH domain-containing protein [Clostridia bacterium]|nr:SPFH domain-containing protein [Clostridia bacterium]
MAIVDVLKFNSDASIFAWKYPNTELATWTQLIVNESQEAVLLKNGQITDTFGPGHYQLTTDNIPVLQKLVNIPFGGKSPFSAEVWFINKAFALDIKWGTTTPIQVQDPKYGVFVPLRAFGQFGIQIEDSRKFLVKLVGTMPFFNTNTLTDYFKGLYITRVKDRLSTCLVASKISILEINSHLDEISSTLSKQLQEEFSEFGIRVHSFYVNDINVPENDPAVKQLKAALAKRAEMDILGYNYQQERTFDTLNTAAGNQGAAGTVMGAGMGVGLGFGIGGAVGNAVGNMDAVLSTKEGTKECPSCHATIGESLKFCPECGADTRKNTSEAKCASCGGSFAVGTKFCPECGKKINPCKNCGSDIPDGSNKCPGCGQILCPECGGTLSAGTKFCPECGKSMVKKCANCGAELTDGKKFCSECGTKTE